MLEDYPLLHKINYRFFQSRLLPIEPEFLDVIVFVSAATIIAQSNFIQRFLEFNQFRFYELFFLELFHWIYPLFNRASTPSEIEAMDLNFHMPKKRRSYKSLFSPIIRPG